MSKRLRVLIPLAMLAVMAAGILAAQNRREDAATRTVQGTVVDASNTPATGAVVQLKDTKTLQVRSFITQQDGAYHFAGLSTNTDYELRAEREGMTSATKTLTVFDNKKTATVNLKLDKRS